MATQSERLRSARQSAGYASAADFARDRGVPEVTYRSHENGIRPLTVRAARLYAKHLKVSWLWLLEGDEKQGRNQKDPRRLVPVVGHVGAGAAIYPLDDNETGGGLDQVEAPPEDDGDLVAVVVRGDSMEDAYHDGDVIYYGRRLKLDDARLLGKDCIVKVEDGRTLVKRIARGARRGRFTLMSHNAPLISDVVLEWAAPVAWVRRRQD